MRVTKGILMLNRIAQYIAFAVFSVLLAMPALADIQVRVSTKSVGFNLARKGAVSCYQTSVRENQAAVQATRIFRSPHL